ncbi:flagellar biosynthetic protein FliR [Jatrophihabitans sp.]|uniref:flagellar biosynthetic protein FliR n=1 Tax=Jatrophihabitans sp. TaxID=1932789 RepID=UPI002CD7AAF7|nr:flagellar biosynthetic protein FliR [Jatrophihabitans sp.]
MSIELGTASVVTLLLASIRITAWLAIAPPFATGGVPRTVRVMLAVGLALAVSNTARAHAPAAELGPLVTSAVEQLVIGASLGFLTRLLFTAVEAAGALIDLSGGFSLAFAYDPLSASTTSVFGKFYGLLATTLIFATNAHLVILQGFLRTFGSLPLDGTMSLAHLDTELVHGVTAMFVAALQIAAPLIAVLFLADVALGLLSRISPQLNVFQVSFPLKIMLTLGLVGLSFATMPRIVTQLGSTAAELMMRIGTAG